MTVVGVIPHSRYIFNPILILCIQHWFVLLAYASKPLYAAVQLVLEYMFEWIVLCKLLICALKLLISSSF